MHTRWLILPLLLLASAGQTTAFGQPERSGWADLEAAAKRFVRLLAEGAFAKAAEPFDRTMANALPPEKLQQIWTGLGKSVGPYQSQRAVRHEKRAGYNIVYVTCQFQRRALDVKVVFDRAGKITGLFFVPSRPKAQYRPPAYADPSRFRETEVTIGSDPWTLPGTLTVPAGKRPVPAVLLVHGSGPNDRDESIGPNKPFQDLAWGLAARGIAALRYDKRTLVHRARMVQQQGGTTVKAEVIDDVFAAVQLLKSQPAVDPGRVFMIGHSLGGYLAPRIAAQDRDRWIAGYVILAGNTRPLHELVLDQTQYLLALDGSLSDGDRQQLEQLEALVRRIKDLSRSDLERPDRLLGAPASYWLDLREYRPAQLAARLDRPMLILQGERDYQVTLKDFQGWKRGLSSRDNVRWKSYPRLNHLFIAGEGKSSPQEYQQPGNVAQQVIDDIANWIHSQPGRRDSPPKGPSPR